MASFPFSVARYIYIYNLNHIYAIILSCPLTSTDSIPLLFFILSVFTNILLNNGFSQRFLLFCFYQHINQCTSLRYPHIVHFSFSSQFLPLYLCCSFLHLAFHDICILPLYISLFVNLLPILMVISQFHDLQLPHPLYIKNVESDLILSNFFLSPFHIFVDGSPFQMQAILLMFVFLEQGL